MWHTTPNEQLQTTLLSNIGLWDEGGVTQLASFMQGSTLLFQSFFPTCVAISSKASTAKKKKKNTASNLGVVKNWKVSLQT
jgi:hypothetical protein